MSTDLRIGANIGGYAVESVLGRGGMSVVYLAEDRKLGRKVALKVMADELAENASFRSRFIREAQMAANLEHPSIVPVYDAGEVDGVLYLAMRVIRGTDLRRVIVEGGPMAPDRALALLRQVASALDTAHRSGLVHRDVKPGNILISHDGDDEHAYLTDFGLTKHVSSKSGLTRTGQFMGTIDYVAPEQIRGDEVDGRTDVYSLGCVLFECLTGSVPFRKDKDVAILFAHLEEPRPRVTDHRPELPGAIDEAIARAMSVAPGDRFGTCLEFVAVARAALELGREDTGPTVAAPPPAPVPPVPPLEAHPSFPPGEAPAAVEDVVVVASTPPAVETPPQGGVGTAEPALPSAPPPAPPAPVAPVRPAPPAGPRRTATIAGIVLVVALLGVGGVVALSGGDDEAAPQPSPTAQPSPTPEPSPTAQPTVEPSPTQGIEVVPAVRAPVKPRATDVTTTSVALAWDPAPFGGEAVRFLVFRDGEQIGKTTKTTFVDRGLEPGTAHVYEIVAVGEDGSQATSKPIEVTTDAVVAPPSGGGGGGGGGGGDECEGLVIGDDCLE